MQLFSSFLFTVGEKVSCSVIYEFSFGDYTKFSFWKMLNDFWMSLACFQLNTIFLQQYAYGYWWLIFKWHLVQWCHRPFSRHSLRALWQGQKTPSQESATFLLFFILYPSPQHTTQNHSWVYTLYLILFCSLVDIQLTFLRKDVRKIFIK